jgi:hypothetical protein
VELPGLLEKKGPEQEFALILQTQFIVKADISGNNAMIKGFVGNKFPLLPPDIKLIKNLRKTPVQYQYTHHEGNNDDDLHKVRFSLSCFRSVRSGTNGLHGSWMQRA